jgi:signal transduction histidine kinase/DNA-binding response OmpR family regulator
LDDVSPERPDSSGDSTWALLAPTISVLAGIALALDRLTPLGAWCDRSVGAGPHQILAGSIGLVTAVAAIVMLASNRESARTKSQLARARNELQRKQADLKSALEAARLKSAFVTHLTREVRAPLTGIVGTVELSLAANPSAAENEHLEAIRSHADVLLGLIDDVTAFSKMETGELELECIPFSLRDSIESGLAAAAPRARLKGIAIARDVPSHVPDAVMGDPARLRQIIAKLVGNGIKFADSGEVALRVGVAAETDHDVTLEFEVKDSGIGIPAERQRTIFEPFHQGDPTAVRAYGGIGLSLPICARLTRLMEGDIKIQSELGKGSTVTFTVRLSLQPAEELRPVPVHTEVKGKRVLVADENASDRWIYTEMLENWEMKPTAVESARSALRVLDEARRNNAPFDLALVDLKMQGTLPGTLIEQIKKDPDLEGVAVIAMTGSGSPGDATWCRAAGAAGYLQKPIAGSDLLEAVRTVLAEPVGALVTRHSLRENRRRLSVVLADDNAVNRTALSRILEKRGHRVVSVDDGRAVVAAANAGGVDVVLIDVDMPDMGAIEAATEIRKAERVSGGHLAIVALTSHPTTGDRNRCLANGMDTYMTKPVEPEQLFAIIDNLTARGGDAPGAADEEPGLQVFDGIAALEHVDGEPDILRQVVRTYEETAPRLVAELHRSLATEDRASFVRAAQRIRGSLNTLGAWAAAKSAERVETLGREGDAPQVLTAVRALEQDLARLQVELIPLIEPHTHAAEPV